MASYEELDPEMRKQVDALLKNARSGPMYAINDFQEVYLREQLSNLVMTCVGMATEKPLTLIERYLSLSDFDQQGMDEVNQDADDWLRERRKQ